MSASPSSDLIDRLRRSVLVGGVLSLALFAGACSDDDDDGGTGPSADCIDEIDFSETIFERGDAEPIAQGGSRESGSLSTSDVEDEAGFFYDVWVADIDAGEVSVEVDPSGFDAYLIVLDADMVIQAEVDQGGVGDAEQVTESDADAGCYVLLVTSFDPEETGSYTLEID